MMKLITKGNKNMKILKIENGVGYIAFNLKNTSEYKKI